MHLVKMTLALLGRCRCFLSNKSPSIVFFNKKTCAIRDFSKGRQRHEQKSKQILEIHSPTFDGKWILPSYIHLPPLPPTEQESQSQSLINHNYKEKKKAPPILLICGWAGAGKCDWGALPKMLASKTNRNVITFDARGIGNSRNITDRAEAEGSCTDKNINLENEFSMESMALDAIAIIKKYYETVGVGIPETNRPIDDDGDDQWAYHQTMDFCVGGASMGGLVAQHIVGLTYASSKNNSGRQLLNLDLDLESFRVTSLGLICTSIAKPIPSSERSSAQPITDLLEEDHFLRSFDAWPSARGEKNHHNELELKEQCISRFFQAMGSKFLSKPGRKALQTKLMKAFIETRKSFINSDNFGIIQQRRELLRQFGDGLNMDILDNTVADNNHYLHIVRTNKIPSAVVHGEDDSVIPVNHAKLMHTFLVEENTRANGNDQNGLPNELFLLQECDHLCWITHGLEVADILGAFWSRKNVCS